MNWFILTGTLAAAGFVQGISGFGFGLVSMSLLPLFMSVKQAAVISTILSLLATIVTFIRHYHDYDWRLGVDFLVSVCIGLPCGVLLLERGSEGFLTHLMGAAMLAYAVRELVTGGQPKRVAKIWTAPWGIFSGAMSGAFNLGGVPTAAYAYGQPWSRDHIMAFLQVMMCLSCTMRIGFYLKAGLTTGISWMAFLGLCVPVYFSIWLGHLMLKKIDPKWRRNGIFGFIAVSGMYYLFLHKGR